MLKENEEITISGKKLVESLSIIEFFLISIRNIARYYYHSDDPVVDREGYKNEMVRLIEEHQLIANLANVRTILSSKFNDELGEDDMDDLEREMEKIKYWEKPGD